MCQSLRRNAREAEDIVLVLAFSGVTDLDSFLKRVLSVLANAFRVAWPPKKSVPQQLIPPPLVVSLLYFPKFSRYFPNLLQPITLRNLFLRFLNLVLSNFFSF